MGTEQWLEALLFVIGVATAAIGILFSWVKGTVDRLDDRLEKRCAKMEEKIDQSRRATRDEIREMRTQAQGVIKMVSDVETSRERLEN